jgi:hypothetical protein
MDTRRRRRWLRIGKAIKRSGYGRTRYYALTKAGVFPPIHKLPGGRAAVVDEDLLDDILDGIATAEEQER